MFFNPCLFTMTSTDIVVWSCLSCGSNHEYSQKVCKIGPKPDAAPTWNCMCIAFIIEYQYHSHISHLRHEFDEHECIFCKMIRPADALDFHTSYKIQLNDEFPWRTESWTHQLREKSVIAYSHRSLVGLCINAIRRSFVRLTEETQVNW